METGEPVVEHASSKTQKHEPSRRAKRKGRVGGVPVGEFPVAIIGTGFSGIAMAVKLLQAGIRSFTIFEKADDIGGTWRDNTYPGAACDIPSHLYSFSFEPKADWSRAYPPQEEIHAYLRHCVEKYDLKRYIRFNSRVEGATFDEDTGTWDVRVAGGESFLARAVVLGNGALSTPQYPDIPGMDEFEGEAFHSARWNHEYDLKGKRVAVIGTGASAIQFVPEIAGDTKELRLFQRTPPWILPKPDRPMRAREKFLFKHVPLTRWLHRASLYWQHEVRAVGFVVNPKLMTHAEKLGRRYLERRVTDPVLREKLTPKYTMGCKRVLMSNNYFETLQRPNVDLVTDAIVSITKTGVMTADGTEHPVDAIIYGTGFTAADYLAPLDIVGRGGLDLNAYAREKAETYYGITANRFPNLFLMMGPNTGLGHNSMIFMIEAQARYALKAIKALKEKKLAFMDVREPVQAKLNARIQERLQRSVWASGCQSWYLKDGHNSTLWPGFTFEYWLATRPLKLGDYDCVPLSAVARRARPGLSSTATAPT